MRTALNDRHGFSVLVSPSRDLKFGRQICFTNKQEHVKHCDGSFLWYGIDMVRLQSAGFQLYHTCTECFCKCPKLLVVCLGSWPRTIILGLINLKASITTFPGKRARIFLLNQLRTKWTKKLLARISQQAHFFMQESVCTQVRGWPVEKLT